MIPVIDFASCSINVPEDQITRIQKVEVGEEICSAFKNIGFVYLKNHGIPNEKVQKVNKVARTFFQLEKNTKTRYALSKDNCFGYVGMELEQLSAQRPADPKETYNITPKNACDEKWPVTELPEFKSTMWDMYNCCMKLSLRILHLLGLALQLQDPDIFVKAHKHMKDASCTTLRTLYYPACTNNNGNRIRCGEHSDYGSITLLFQDQVGGLEVMNTKGEYVAATPIPGTVIVNVGDLLQRWTADILKSTKHRVVNPTTDKQQQETRQSLAFFVNPDDAEVIQCIDGSAKYGPIRTLDYLNMKMNVNYKI